MFLKQHPNAFFPLVAGQIVVLVRRTLDPMVSCVMFFWSACKIYLTLFDRILNKLSSDRLFNERKIIICQTVTEFVLLFNYLAFLISSILAEIVFIYFSQWDKCISYEICLFFLPILCGLPLFSPSTQAGFHDYFMTLQFIAWVRFQILDSSFTHSF